MLKFTSINKENPSKVESKVRSKNFDEIYANFAKQKAEEQASCCSQCGVPFCQVHCPLHNNIPDWLKLTAENRLEEAYQVASSTNNMPEICGRICPQDRLCEGNCVIEQSGHGTVTIGSIEKYITDTAWDKGWIKKIEPTINRDQTVGVIGAGPAGLAAAEELRKLGYNITIYDRYDRAGGLLIYGIPNFKLEKEIVTRRTKLLEDSGVEFKLNPRKTATMMMERARVEGQSWTRSMFEPGGSSSIEVFLKQQAAPIQWKVDQGWPREQAEAATLITAAVNASLAASVRDRSDRYAASAHAVFEAMSGAARRQTAPAPLLYKNLTGEFGLATEDPAFQALLQSDVAPGVQLFTNGVGNGDTADADTFPDESGFRLKTSQTHDLIDSDIVCFRSAPADADGLHTLIPWDSVGTCKLPPMATVTLEKIDEPGEWEVMGKRVKRRLYTVSVSYRL